MAIQSRTQGTSEKDGTGAPDTSRLPIPSRLNFSQAAPQGFGDRHNSWAWSMLWWKDKLYVGTNRAWHCAERAGINSAFPFLVKYPPDDPDAECATDARNLPLQAEIWRWTPETDEWERVYQSPQDVPIPDRSGKYVAREVGFRDMAIFVEPNGTQAMYVSGVNARFIFRPVPPPRLLRSTDGHTFESVPQEPGTFMGELDTCSFRTIAVYKDRLFVSTGTIQGDGVLLESSNPAAGNDHFRQVSPPGMSIFEMIPFNGYLYVGVHDVKRGYAVLKTNATGSSPYTFTPVVTDGAFLSQPSRGVISLHVYKDRLYVGTDRPAAEVIRINSDDTWDLVIGTPRETPDGWKYPLSGLDAGFNNWLNGHIWRMETYNGHLYIGTWNMGTEFRKVTGADSVLRSNYGFDLYETANGWHYVPVTLTGFNDRFNYGLRSFTVTPYGFFIGTANMWYGLQIWRGVPVDSPERPCETETVGAAGSIAATDQSESQTIRPAYKDQKLVASFCPPPEYLEIETVEDRVILSWENQAEARQYHIWRACVTDERPKVETNPILARLLRVVRSVLSFMPDLYLPPLPDQVWIPGAYTEVGVTERFYFEDTTAVAGRRYLYYVRAEDRSGNLSVPSNIVAIPLLTPLVTFGGLLEMLDGLASRGKLGSRQSEDLIHEKIRKARTYIEVGDTIKADKVVQSLSHDLAINSLEVPDLSASEDLQVMLMKLRRRVVLSQAGVIPKEGL